MSTPISLAIHSVEGLRASTVTEVKWPVGRRTRSKWATPFPGCTGCPILEE